jgi:flagellar motor switch protein FliN
MAGESLMNMLTAGEQALASIALPPAGPAMGDVPHGARTRRWDEGHVRTASAPASVALRVELGRTQLRSEELIELRKGSVVPLDRLAGDSVDVYADGRLVARGEVLALDGKFGVRVVEVVADQKGGLGTCGAAAGTAAERWSAAPCRRDACTTKRP